MKQSYTISMDNITVEYFCGHDAYARLCGDQCNERYEITYLLSASGRYIVEGGEHKISCGSLLLITPMSYHKVILDEYTDIEGYRVFFNRVALRDEVAMMLDRITDEGDSYGRVFSPRMISASLSGAFDRFAIIENLGKSEGRAYTQAILSEIIILLSAAEGEKMKGGEEVLGARVAGYLNSNIEKNISLDRLARRFFVSKYYLCRAFKSYTGISVHAYVNQKRIIYAKRLIESGMTASGAAERVGFGDYSAFYRAYVKIVGKSPTA